MILASRFAVKAAAAALIMNYLLTFLKLFYISIFVLNVAFFSRYVPFPFVNQIRFLILNESLSHFDF